MPDTTRPPEVNPQPHIDRIRRGAVILGLFAGLAVLIVVTLRSTAPAPRRTPDEPAPVGLADPALSPEELERLQPPAPRRSPLAATPSAPQREASSATAPAPARVVPARGRRARRPTPRVAPLAVDLGSPRSRDIRPGTASHGARRDPLASFSGIAELAGSFGSGEVTEGSLEPSRETPPDPRQLNFAGESVVRVQLSRPPTRWVIRQGTLIPAVLTQGVASSVGGMLRAQVSRDIYDTATLSRVLIPRGTVALAEQARQPLLGEDRLLVLWRRLILPDGRSFDLAAPAAAPDGSLGLPGRVDNHWGRRFGAAGLLSLVSAGLQLSQPQRSGDNGTAASSGQVAAGAAGLELGRLSQEILRELLRIPPTVTLEPGSPVTLLAVQDLAFPEPSPSPPEATP